MKTRKPLLLINPRITSKPRFPLAVMQLATALRADRPVQILDGNVHADFAERATALLASGDFAAVGLSVMGGPQLVSALAASRAIRQALPGLPIVWGGYFPTICPDAALNGDSPVSQVVRGPGEATLAELLRALDDGAAAEALAAIDGLSWRHAGQLVHNRERAFSAQSLQQPLDYHGVDQPQQYLRPTYLGRRTTGYQAALGCRYRCTFCGVAAMFRGKTALPGAERLDRDLGYLKAEFGADSVQFYDHNFFDRESAMLPLLEVLAHHALPWWCYARADALAQLSEAAWALVRRSRLRMAYIGAETPNPQLLREMRKGTQVDQTLAAVEQCRRHGVIPELSFMLAPPHDPEGETERCFDFIRRIKRLHPAAEIMLHINTPLPTAPGPGRAPLAATPLRDLQGQPVRFPDHVEGWAEPAWVAYWCHRNAPWVSERLLERIRGFTTVLGCRFPTVTDIRAPSWQRRTLSASAAWRYRFGRYERPWELQLLQRMVRLWDPQLSSL
ncbi:radical SAM protein [Pelomonas sp. SE-A7]|uniref:B12-binding domain-containing radical SAM protein n=1 Tax=Pelomonas sp. SE-A7 TaxID=3054953 RepID=UPI00259C9D25|nr:radical SAM protein [Pelomonas sp. SE-A7]MDM4765393.1 radical SAM protein [Pelomonas sp. SE-A7]